MKIPLFLLSLLVLGSCAKFDVYKPEGVREAKNVFTPAWIKNLDPAYETGNLPISLGSPLIHDGVVYAGNNNGTMDAYSIKNGRLLWREKIKDGFQSAPIVYENLLIYGDVSGRVYAKDIVSGDFKYQFDLGSSVDSTLTVSKGRLFVHTRNHKLFAIDALTGKVLWSYKRSIPFFSTLQRTSKPLVVENRVFVGFADGFLLAFSLEEGQVVWEKKMSTADKFVDVDMSPTYFRGKLIVSSINGQAEVIDPQSGALHNRLAFTTNRDAYYLGSSVVFGTIDGKLVIVDSSFNVEREVKVSTSAISSMSAWKNGYVITTVGKELIYIDQKFNVISKYDLGSVHSAVFGVVSVEDDHLAMMSSRNRLYLFK
ncbi:PQQ-binding-like beta-propeller repeat protein [Bacteriovorax sp. Seq25_V]|uniref:outer membrane protein assembly factor BamB family protein n=1 Tax=Bacteriovorax sp. Seq25_V TaxID=1201288 RepID=UPI00038A1864|nr:PQQ-binding-like beta-propeller repeat protein [Bacteriovorax sp. Seq25_V]EQC46157.1 PQQ enzyme repeat protein [Bacteriovorax sp. Seq25_V]